MTVRYDARADAAYIRLSDAPVSRTEETSDVCILDFDASDRLVGIELLSVFGFAGSSLQSVAAKGLISATQASEMLNSLRGELVAA